MAANKFATMLHKNSHKLTVILVYALLEWILIILLLLNSFFFYLITKFANYFGLKPPCLWCSSLDHLFHPANNATASCTDLLCETHATGISRLGFCSNHRKLAETQNMCTECLASCPNHNHNSISMATRIAFISLENGCNGTVKSCSCCNRSFSDDLYSPYCLLLKHSWKALKYTEKGGLIIEDESKFVGKPDSLGEIDRNEIGGEEHQMLSDVGSFGLKDSLEECSGSESNLICFEKEEDEDRKAEDRCVIENDFYELNCVRSSLGEDFSLEFIDLHFDKDFECQTDRLIPVELLDSSIFGNRDSLISNDEDETSDSPLQLETKVDVSAKEENTNDAETESIRKIMDDNVESSVLNGQKIMQTAHFSSTGINNNIQMADTEESDDLQAQEEETNAKIFSVDQAQDQESTAVFSSLQEDHFSTNNNGAEIETCMVDSKIGTDNNEGKIFVGEGSISADKNQETRNQLLLIHSESNEAEEEKFPETPTSVDSYNCLHKKLLYEKRESGTEESIDGSVSSEIDTGDPVLTVEKLATALKSERKALNALYAELEEERSASAIAANQTMAMINRLQEEKAAMQMEALQYQRMMEEQSEYDQEALQLLNELMMKREREKLELERELEVYRKKVMDYEAKERVRMMRRSKDGSVRSRTSSATCSNAEDIDELSIDLNREARDEDNTANDEEINLEEIALDCVKQIGALDDSLAEFEEERLSILDQLKALEEKLITLHNNELEQDKDSVDNSSKCSVEGFDENYELSTPDESDVPHSLSKDKHVTGRKTLGSMVKSLLPLLDAAENETEEGLLLEENGESEFVEMEQTSVQKFQLYGKKVALEEEVGHVYERLHALEADREFLKHCMSSLKKGDKGMDLLQQILQHLRDLRAVELRVRNMSGDPLD